MIGSRRSFPSRLLTNVFELGRAMRFIFGHPTNRGHPARTLARYVGWQIYKRSTRRPTTIRYVNGTRLRVYGDNRVASSVLYTALPEFDEMKFLLNFLAPDDVFVDVGANIGMYTVLALSAAPRGAVIAFEPDLRTFHRLAENVEINGMTSRVVLHRAAVGERVGTVSFTTTGDGTNHIAGPVDADVQEVPMTTLDETVRGRRIAAVKLDVEGAELRALDGARSLMLEAPPLVWIVELIGLGIRYGTDDDGVTRRFADYGYRPYKYLAEKHEFVPFQRASATGNNAVFVMDVDEIRRRLRRG